ncbi:MAG: hypothetical protein HRT71_00030 [Flavobacteriales bacterium]|nr:hypothetical protein [Flavobacteriales bacterium]
MKKLFLIILLVPMLAILQSYMAPDKLSETLRWSIIKTGKSIALFEQCSRSEPEFKKLIDVEPISYAKAFIRLQEMQAVIEKKISNRLINYTIQVAGFKTKDKVEKIYFNCFLTDKHAEKEMDWQNTAVVKCDGSNANWGMVYNTETNNFELLKTNGPARVNVDNVRDR